jgi:hypothetical protein
MASVVIGENLIWTSTVKYRQARYFLLNGANAGKEASTWSWAAGRALSISMTSVSCSPAGRAGARPVSVPSGAM